MPGFVDPRERLVGGRLIKELAERSPAIPKVEIQQPLFRHHATYVVIVLNETLSESLTIAPAFLVDAEDGKTLNQRARIEINALGKSSLACIASTANPKPYGVETAQPAPGFPFEQGKERGFDGLHPLVGIAGGEDDFGVGIGSEQFIREADTRCIRRSLCRKS